MTKGNILHAAFNRGRVSRYALARDDLQGNRIRYGAEEQNNFLPLVLGSAGLRPGLEYTGTSRNNAKAVHIPLLFATDDTAIAEITAGYLRVKLDETPITRVSVGTALQNASFAAYLTNGGFDSGTGWTAGAGWAISAGKANATLSNASVTQTAGYTLVAGKSYSITYTTTRSVGSVVATVGGASGVSRTTSATFTETIVAGATQVIGFTGTGFTGTIDNVSIEPLDTGWADADESGSVSTVASGKMNFKGTGFASAMRKQLVTVAGGDANKEHALRIVVDRGPVTFRCGSTDGGDEYVRATALGTGEHSLAFTPTGNFYLQFSSFRQYTVIVGSIAVESAGVMEIATPWLEADLKLIRWERSQDVHWLWCKGYQQRKLERRGTGRSFSVALYQPEDGPFRIVNTGPTRITPSATSGDITLTASRSLFRSTHVGALFQMTSIGQLVEANVSGEDQWSDPIRVIGTSTGRTFDIDITGTWAGTVTLQRSVDAPGAWVDVVGHSWTGNVSTSYFDALNNQIIYYRIGIKTGDYTSGTASVSLTYAAGGITGVARVTAYSSATLVSAVVLKALGGIDSTANWREGEWSSYRGFPSAGQLTDGRLASSGQSKFIASVSDAYEGFDPNTEGDSGPINRSIPVGNSEDVQWMVDANQLLIGTTGGVVIIKSSSLGEPITPTLFNAKKPDTRGCATAPAEKLDTSVIFIAKSGTKLIEAKPDATGASSDYTTGDGDLTAICPEVGLAGFVKVVVQRYPDTRIHCMRADGTVGMLVKEPEEEVLCWIDIETDGDVEDMVVIPAEEGSPEDKVYYHINRTVNGGTVRYLERWAAAADCKGGTLNKQADSFGIYEGVATDTIPAPHLEGCEVVVWADGKDFSPLDDDREPRTYTVTGGVITLDEEVESVVYGLFYRARFKGTKLAYLAQIGTAISQRKRVDSLGLVLADMHHKGLYIGGNFETMDCLQQVVQGEEVADDTIHADLDLDMMEFPGDWSTDARVCLEMSAPRPGTVLAMVVGMATHEK